MNSANASNIDLQSWWEVPSIAHFCSLFRVAFNLLDFDIEELEEALLTDGTELNGSSLLQELIVRLLSGCLGHNGISTSNYQMFLRRLFRTKCKEQGRENPFNTDIDFQFLPLRTKVEILHVLCDFRLDADDVVDVLKNLDSDSLRVHPLGYDENRSAYWYFYGTRLYREDYSKKRKKKKDRVKIKAKKKRKEDSSSEDEDDLDDEERDEEEEEEEEDTGRPPTLGSWQVMCYTEEDWRKLAHSLAHSTCKEEKALYQVLSEDFLPEIPRLFEEKERLQRKRLLENQPRRQSQRIEKLKSQKESAPPPSSESAKLQGKPRQDRDTERANRQKGRAEKNRRKRSLSRSNSESGSSLNHVLPSGRQTNNSLASATGEIYIKPSNSQKFRSALFRRTHEDLMTGLYKILDRVKAHDDAWPFRVPVDEKFAPRYYAVIARPMDLQTMEDKLDNAEYGSLVEFRADFQLIVDNCRQYNGSGNEYTDMAKRLQVLFEACAERFFEAEPSSDDSLPPLRRHAPENLDQDEDSLGSSLTPDDRPPSIISDHSQRPDHPTSSGESIVMSDGSSALDEYVPGRGRMEQHDSRKRKRRKMKRGRPNTGLSGDTDSSSRSNSLSNRSDAPLRIERNMLNRDTEYDRVVEKGRGVTQRRMRTEEEKERSYDDDVERARPKVNYKEEDTSESDILSDSSEDSFIANNKSKSKLCQGKRIIRRAGVLKNIELIEELDQVTEDVLMDITRMLEDIPIFSDFSSNSNSPLHPSSFVIEDSAADGEFRKRASQSNRPRDRFSNEIHRRRLYKEQLGIKRKREIQRTIDRLQPGKSKGNLLSKDKKVDDDHLAGETKDDSKNSPTVPSISLGKVLETDVLGFGIGEPPSIPVKKESEDDEITQDKLTIEEDETEGKEEKSVQKEEPILEKVKDDEVVEKPVEPEKKKEKPTPNLSAWFKAFGAPKPSSVPKKKLEIEESKIGNEPKKEEESVEEEKKNIGEPIELPARRQRKTSTGSSISERSSFSQEPLDGNSPRPSLDEPYQSPQQELKPYHHPPINGTIKVGFYQDTCFPRGTSDKSSSSPRDLPSCSPRDLPSVSPRTPYCSPRNTPIGLREYPSISPRTPYSRTLVISPRHYPASPRTEYNNDLMMRRDYPPMASPREYPIPMSPRDYPSTASHREYIGPVSPRDYPPPSSPRDYPPPSSPRDYPPPSSPRDYPPPSSPRNYPPPSSPRDYPPPSSPRDYPPPSSPRNYPPPSSPHSYPPPSSPRSYPPPSSPRNYPPPSSPREYNPPTSPREYPPPTSPRDYTSPASPREYRTPPSPREYSNPQTPIEYRKPPVSPTDYPPPVSPREMSRTPISRDSLSSPRPREECQLPRPEYESYNGPRSPSAPIYGGVPPYPSHLYFEANKQVSDFRPVEKTPVYPMKKRAYNEIVNNSPVRSPEPSTPYKSGGSFTPTRGAMEQERTFTPTPGRLPGPSATPSIPIGLPHHPLQQHIIDQYAEEGRRITSPFYPTETVYNKPQPASSMFAPQFINRGDPNSSRSSTPHQPNSPTSVPINYSNPANCKDQRSRSPTPQKEIVNATPLNYGKVSNPSGGASYASNRIEDMLQDRGSPQFNRSLAELPHFPTGQDLSKLQQLHQSEIQRYSQMTNLGYNYHQMIQGKSPSVYNHPMQELIQTKSSFGNMIQSNLSTFRPMADIVPNKVNEREVPFTPRLPPKAADKLPKKNRKKKVEPSPPSSGFQHYVASSTESSPPVPGSAFNFGPPTPQSLKESYGAGGAFLEQPYYDGSPGKPPFFLGRGAAAAYPHHPFISQAQYQEYLLHHGVLPPTPGYPSPAAYLGIHSPINRPSWL